MSDDADIVERLTIEDCLGPLPASPLRDRIKATIEILIAETVAAEREACAKIGKNNHCCRNDSLSR